jgi:RNA polymerase sigma-70 factor (ECF subfamily)
MTEERILAAETMLLAQLRAGSLDALGVLYDRYQRMVFRTALGITGDPEVAADLLQDVFLRLYRFARRIDPQRPLAPWLYRMTANQSLSWVKRHNRWSRPLEDATDWLLGEPKNGPQQRAELNDTWGQVQQALQVLPVGHRTVVVMYYMNELSLHEISEILDIPVGTVKSRLHYGRQALKEHLGLSPKDNLPEMRYEFT